MEVEPFHLSRVGKPTGGGQSGHGHGPGGPDASSENNGKNGDRINGLRVVAPWEQSWPPGSSLLASVL